MIVNTLTAVKCNVPDMPPRTLQERAKFARLRAGYSLPQQAADAIGCSRPLVLAWESGAAKSIGSKYLLEAARAYKVRPEWLNLESDDDGFPWSPERVSEPTVSYAPSSQSPQPEFEKMASAVYLLREYLEIVGDPPEWVSDPVMLEIAWWVVEGFGAQVTPNNVIDLTKRLGSRIRSAKGDEGNARSDTGGGQTAGAPRRRTA